MGRSPSSRHAGRPAGARHSARPRAPSLADPAVEPAASLALHPALDAVALFGVLGHAAICSAAGTAARVPASVRLCGAMTSPPVDRLEGLVQALDPAFRLDQEVVVSPERALYRAWDRILKRYVALRVHLVPDAPGRAWFLRETETLAALDHPPIRHAYAAGIVGPFAYRTANSIEGDGLAAALPRGPRPIPTAHALARDLLGPLDHAHPRGAILRRIAPIALLL